MAMPNLMKEKIAGGEPAFGVSIMFPSPQIVEMLGHAGFAWVLLYCEHGSIGAADIELMAMAADAVGITAIARPKSNSSSDIQAVMDRGIKGVEVPHIRSKAEAEWAVESVKFGPEGARGLAVGTRPDRWGFRGKMADFVESVNAQSLVCLQIEDAEALPRVDVFFIGPSDLSQSLEHPGNPKAAPVAAAISETFSKIRVAGKAPGMPATTDTLDVVREAGCLYVYSHLPKLLGAETMDYLAKAHR